jgi:spore coat polysaccharide biosynthesis protein SpsF (cytidylyltransferase family)
VKKAILIQARLSSSRFPKKMLSNLGDYKLVEYVYKRCNQSKVADNVMIITSNEKSDDELYTFCLKQNIPIFRGDLNNVLKRYLDASQKYNFDIVCRVCGDSPFVDVNAIDKMLEDIEKKQLDYINKTNILNGFMSEVFTLNLLKKVYNMPLTLEDKEHVTKYIRDNISEYKTSELDLNLRDKELEKYTLTVDYPQDLEIANSIANNLDGFDFKSNDIIKILKNMEDENEL